MRYLHTMVRVKDLGESMKFYCDLMGLEEIRRIENEKGRFTLVFLAARDDISAAREKRRLPLNSPTIGTLKITPAAAISGTWPMRSTIFTTSVPTFSKMAS